MSTLGYAPPRNVFVTAGAWLVTAIIACLVVIVGMSALHLLHLPNEISQAGDETNSALTGFGEMVYYVRDILGILFGVLMGVLLIRALPNLFGGSSLARNRALLVCGLTALMCTGYGLAWHSSTQVTTSVRSESDLTDRIAALQTQDTPHIAAVVMKVAVIGAPVGAILLAILLVNPASTRYFQAMRRAGHY